MADVFWLNRADFQPVAKASSASEIAVALKKAPKEVFFHHLTAKKNDFANWALHSLKNPDLAAKLSAIRHDDKELVQKVISAFEGVDQKGGAVAAESQKPQAKISAPGFPSKDSKEFEGKHPQADELKKQAALSVSDKHSIGAFNLPGKKK